MFLFWAKASGRPGIPRIVIPALPVNAADVPFPAKPCYRIDEAQAGASFFDDISSEKVRVEPGDAAV